MILPNFIGASVAIFFSILLLPRLGAHGVGVGLFSAGFIGAMILLVQARDFWSWDLLFNKDFLWIILGASICYLVFILVERRIEHAGGLQQNLILIGTTSLGYVVAIAAILYSHLKIRN